MFEEARNGLFQFTLYEAYDLRIVDPTSRQDPFVQLALGASYVKKSKTVRKGGANPYFGEEEILMWIDQVLPFVSRPLSDKL